jgi:hypothetical protein
MKKLLYTILLTSAICFSQGRHHTAPKEVQRVKYTVDKKPVYYFTDKNRKELEKKFGERGMKINKGKQQ